MTYIIAVSNEKGGVAKTTSTISLGAALAETGLEVLLIDLDAQANLTLALGLEQPVERPTIATVLLENLPAQQAVRHTAIARLDLIPASAEMRQAERLLPARVGAEKQLTQAIREQDWAYDFVLMDCPPFLGAVTSNALMASHLLIMPTQPEFFSIHALRNMLSTVRSIRAHGNPRLTYRLLLTLFDRRNRIHRSMSEQLRETFSSGVLETVIEVDTRLRESSIAGLPILHHSPKSRSALQYRALAQEIISYVQETSSQPS